MEPRLSGVGVIDKSFALLAALGERSPQTLAELVEATAFHKATAHRLAAALEVHGLVRRLDDGRYTLGFGWLEFASKVDGASRLVDLARPHLAELSASTGESAQLYVRDGSERVCVAVSESEHGLRTIVPVGRRLTLSLGSGAAVLRGEVSAQGFVESIAEREAGVASVSAPIMDGDGQLVAAISVSGPVDRMSEAPGERFGALLVAEAGRLSADLAC